MKVNLFKLLADLPHKATFSECVGLLSFVAPCLERPCLQGPHWRMSASQTQTGFDRSICLCNNPSLRGRLWESKPGGQAEGATLPLHRETLGLGQNPLISFSLVDRRPISFAHSPPPGTQPSQGGDAGLWEGPYISETTILSCRSQPLRTSSSYPHTRTH